MRGRAVLPTIAAASGGVAVVLLVATVVLGVPWAPDREWAIAMYWALAWVGLPVVGAVIAAKRPSTRIGWLLIAGGLGVGIGQFGGMWGLRAVHTAPGTLPAGELGLYLTEFELVGFVLIALALLHFPGDGLPSRRWRLPVGVVAIALPLGTVGRFFSAELAASDQLPPVPNPYAHPLVTPVVEPIAGFLLLYCLGFGLVVLANLAWRAVRSRGVERQQMKWVGYVAGLFVGFLVLMVSLENLAAATALPDTEIAVVGFFVCFNGFAVAIGVAVLRYRLYDIERVASRTATYAVLTVLLALVYAAGVVGIGAVLRPLSGEQGGDLVVAASTLAVAALFAPLRRRVQAVMDRRFNRSQVDAARAVGAFAQRLRNEVDRDALTGLLREAATRAVQPARAHVWLR